MEFEGRQDLKISGAGSASGGSYNEVKISGAGEIKGDIDCSEFKVSGASEIKGNVKAKFARISGASDIRGNLISDEILVSGASNVGGDVIAKRVKISGGSNIKGNLHAEDVEISGGIEIKGDCEAENFAARGGFDIGGLLNAGNVDIRVGGLCRVSEIGCERIEVKVADSGFFALKKLISDIFNFRSSLKCTVIEGDDIYLEATTAKIVRGNNVVIASDCEIELVEYKNDLKVQGNGRVKEQRRI